MLELRSRLFERPLNRLLTRALSRGDSLRRSGDSRLLQAPSALDAPGRSSAASAGVGVSASPFASSSLGAGVEPLAADLTERIDEWGLFSTIMHMSAMPLMRVACTVRVSK